jgi:hypothetical protein
LPSAINALLALLDVPEEVIDAAIADGRINPHTMARGILNISTGCPQKFVAL